MKASACGHFCRSITTLAGRRSITPLVVELLAGFPKYNRSDETGDPGNHPNPIARLKAHLLIRRGSWHNRRQTADRAPERTRVGGIGADVGGVNQSENCRPPDLIFKYDQDPFEQYLRQAQCAQPGRSRFARERIRPFVIPRRSQKGVFWAS